ncbi:thioredoxin domain-containing protein [Actinotalea sp. M2MS4P-6]|uniref:DsbA family protein n=1 Tax=Actinotalea sp. M2MS4P-6 TaxID=2983762 RepID=UPI0021E409BE|nr:thioredoxin domain-containing protein [Actinotalea sp. M2MS4P-6]MCV2395064.1 thioredoxin domain-containing protein [Actinotalea sp. M2MS4P-6]
MSSSPKDRREEAKAAAAALKSQQAKAAARQRTIAIAALVVGLVVVGVLVAVILNNGSKGGSAAATGDQVTPASVSTRGGVVFDSTGLLQPGADAPGEDGELGTADDLVWPQSLAASGGPVVVSVYFDFMCPWCGYFEQTQGATLDKLLASGDIVIDSHPIAILDRYSNGTNYSSRAAAAAFAVAEGSPEHYFDFVEAMMADGTQPEENSDGLTNAEISAIAAGVGVPQEVLDQIESGAFVDYTATATDLASQDLGQLQTPTVLLNGQQMTENWTEDGVLEQAIEAAKG